MNLEEKYIILKNIISNLGSAVVAFSGGVDSTFLSKAVYSVLGEKCAAITIVSPMLPKSEIDDAVKMANNIGIRHVLVSDDKIEEKVSENPIDRCYYCKKTEFGNIIKEAEKMGIKYVLDGSNADDVMDYRPGATALSELKIRSPLKEAGLTKSEIRELSKLEGLETWDKPAFACLASRIPYGEKIDIEKLKRVEMGESFLREIGFKQFRVRSHEDMARIEIARDERYKILNEEMMDKISEKLKSFGFIYVSMELGGYKMGNMNAKISMGENQ